MSTRLIVFTEIASIRHSSNIGIVTFEENPRRFGTDNSSYLPCQK
jgi:hypothetical protein